MDKRVAALASLVLSACASVPDNGGLVGQYIAKVAEAKRTGELVKIDAPCLSACTLWLSMPRDKLCVGPHAVFVFHSATSPTERSGDGVLMAYYPDDVKAWLQKSGGLTDRLKVLGGEELHRIVRSCA